MKHVLPLWTSFPAKNIFNHFNNKHTCIGCEFLKQTLLAKFRFFCSLSKYKSYFKCGFGLSKLTDPQKLVFGVKNFGFSSLDTDLHLQIILNHTIENHHRSQQCTLGDYPLAVSATENKRLFPLFEVFSFHSNYCYRCNSHLLPCFRLWDVSNIAHKQLRDHLLL